jgi:hypothetical protein
MLDNPQIMIRLISENSALTACQRKAVKMDKKKVPWRIIIEVLISLLTMVAGYLGGSENILGGIL